MKVDSGYLIIADITGYTACLSKSELEHAHDILQSLIQTIIEQINAPLVISRLQGDAVICYAKSCLGPLFRYLNSHRTTTW